MGNWDVDLAACRSRQARLWTSVAELKLDAIIVTQIEHIQWLVGPRFSPLFQPAAALWPDGRVVLVAPAKWQGDAAASDIITYSAKHHSTLRNDQRQVSTEALMATLARAMPRRLGVEFSTFGRHWELPATTELLDVEPSLYRLRRRKDADELARIRHAIGATGAMYDSARQLLRPGVSELEMFSTLQSVAVNFLGEMLTGTGNDYQCGARGGPPRGGRTAQDGELYILDLGPAFRGYFADNCRTLAVSSVSPLQRQAWEQVAAVFPFVEATVHPGVSARQLFDDVQKMLNRAPCGVFNHHLGHGIGLYPHEAPHLNPHWDDTFEVGDVFTVEPGLYAPELHAGLRLENDYLVTETGVELLSPFPLELDAGR